jgi:hypothetical protein
MLGRVVRRCAVIRRSAQFQDQLEVVHFARSLVINTAFTGRDCSRILTAVCRDYANPIKDLACHGNFENDQGVACRSPLVHALGDLYRRFCHKVPSQQVRLFASVPRRLQGSKTRAERKVEERLGRAAAVSDTVVQPVESSSPSVTESSDSREITEASTSRASDVQVRRAFF